MPAHFDIVHTTSRERWIALSRLHLNVASSFCATKNRAAGLATRQRRSFWNNYIGQHWSRKVTTETAIDNPASHLNRKPVSQQRWIGRNDFDFYEQIDLDID